jgi:hypothetical protein
VVMRNVSVAVTDLQIKSSPLAATYQSGVDLAKHTQQRYQNSVAMGDSGFVAGANALNLGIGDVVGYTPLLEGLLGVDSADVRLLNGGERALRGAFGVAQTTLSVFGFAEGLHGARMAIAERMAQVGEEGIAKNRSLQSYYPPNRGFAGPSERVTLQPGELVDRYGSTGGSFASPKGTPLPERSVPFGAEQKQLQIFRVLKPVEADAGKVSSWFNQPGGGKQYDFGRSIQELIDDGVVEKVK